MLFYYILLFLLGLIIFKKTTIIITFIILNINYIIFIFHYLIGTDIFRYITGITIATICVFRQDVILPFSIIYLFLFILYELENVNNFFGDFNSIV